MHAQYIQSSLGLQFTAIGFPCERTNVWATAGGIMPQCSAERQATMGAWLDVYDEAIYGAKPGPLQGVDWRRSTAMPGKV